MGANVRIAGGDRVYDSTALEKSKVVSTAKGFVHTILCYNGSGVDIFLQMFDAASLPADGQPPTVAPLKVPAGTTDSLDWTTGRPIATGLAICASSTDVTKTLVLANSVWFSVVYQES